MHHLAGLPIPETNPPATIPTRDKTAIRTNPHIRAIPRGIMPAEALLAVLPKAVTRCIHDDLVVAALERDGFARGVRERGRERVHVGLGDEFDGNGDVELPGAQGFVVGGGDEAAVGVDEGDGVDRLQVVVVFLRHFAGAGVVLDDFLVGEAGEEFVGGGRVGFHDVWDARCADPGGAFAGFGVPSVGGVSWVGGGEVGERGGVGHTVLRSGRRSR